MRLTNYILSGALILTSINLCVGQSKYKVVSESTLEVLGTSTLHDWEMITSAVEGTAFFTLQGDQLADVSDLAISTRAETLKSEKKGLDNNAYKALNTSDHPEIKFTLKETKSLKVEGKGSSLIAYGDLSIAGSTVSIEVPAECLVTNKRITCIGSYATKLTLFNVDPPTVMFGAIKTGDDVQIKFNLSFEN